MDFQTPKFWELALLNNHYQISKNEGNQNFKLSKLALNIIQHTNTPNILVIVYTLYFTLHVIND